MARIRSIHPGFFTDEALVSVSMAARLLVLGLGAEADDKGIFEWKPLTIKMRIFPADQVDVVALLSELVSANVVTSYEVDGRKYGAIRNFRVFQKPKKPNDIHPITDDVRTYVGLSQCSSEPVGNQFGTGGEKSPQMEDGGWRMEDGGCNQDAHATGDKLSEAKARSTMAIEIGQKCARIIGWQDGDPTKNFAPIHQWLADGATEDLILTKLSEVMAKRNGSPPTSLVYFNKPIGEAIQAEKQRRHTEDAAVSDRNKVWVLRLNGFRKNGLWLGDYGPKPGQPGCLVPAEVIQRWGV